MKLFKRMKDGGQESTVVGYWLIEWKNVFSIVLLNFQGVSREAYHNHAFNSISWVLKGMLTEEQIINKQLVLKRFYRPSIVPVITTRNNMHKVSSNKSAWVLSFRGPWRDTWEEFLPAEDRVRTLTGGRIEL